MNKKSIIIDSDGFVLLSEFEDILDIRKVHKYSVRKKKDGSLILTFYDKSGKKVLPHVK